MFKLMLYLYQQFMLYQKAVMNSEKTQKIHVLDIEMCELLSRILCKL